MKNTKWYAGLLACVSLLFASCSEKEMIETTSEQNQKMILKGSLESNIVSRSAVTDEGVFSWLEGDQISVQASDGKFYTFDLLSGAGTNGEGCFTGSLTSGATIVDENWAVSPLVLRPEISSNGGGLRLYLPNEYTWQPGQTNAMMLARVENGCLSFKNLGGLIKFSVNNIKNECRMVVISTTHQISGKMEPVESNSYYELRSSRLNGTTESRVEIVSTYEDSKQAFYLPLPVAEGMKLNVKIYEGDDLRVEKNATLSIKRSQLILMPTITLPETGSAIVERVESAGAVNNALKDAVANDKKDISITINSNYDLDEGEQPSSTIEISEPIVIPAELTSSESTSINLTFDEIPVGTVSGSRVVLTDNSQMDGFAESLSKVMVAIPEVTGNAVAPDFDINLPTTTVTLAATQETASYGTVWAKTANNTLIVDEGVSVNNLLALQGSIEISGIVENLERSKAHGYGDEKTRVLVRKGGKLNNVANAETDFLITVEGDDEPSEDVVVITNTGFARALNWYLKENQKMDGIELDENGYAIIDRKLAESITYIWTGDSNRKNTFTTLEGIEHFVNLESIKSAYGKLEECDFSKNKKLKEVYLQSNNLKSLDFSANPSMEVIYCPNNLLTKLDVSGLANLEDLHCGNQQAGTLTLTLNDAQKNKWTEKWKDSESNNDIKIFGEDDDFGTAGSSFNGTVNSFAELQEALKSDEAQIQIGESFDLTAPLKINRGQRVKINLQGNALSVNLPQGYTNPETSGAKAFIANYGSLTISNGTLNGHTVNDTNFWRFILNESADGFSLSGVTINNYTFNWGISILDTDAVIDYGTIINAKDVHTAFELDHCNLDIEDIELNGNITVHENVNLTINDGYISGRLIKDNGNNCVINVSDNVEIIDASNSWITTSGGDDGNEPDYSGEFEGTVENYEQLAEALKYKRAIITIVKSFDITGPLRINGMAELYLKTNTLTVTASFEKEALITNQGKLLICAGTIKNGNNGILFSNLSKADLTLAGVTVIDSANEKYFMLNQGTLTIRDNGVEMPSSITGTINNLGGTMSMESGIIVGDIMNQSSGIINIYSGSITGNLHFPEANMGNQNAAITIVNGVVLNGEGWDDERIGRK